MDGGVWFEGFKKLPRSDHDLHWEIKEARCPQCDKNKKRGEK